MVRGIVCERNIYTAGESRSISFNANEPEKQKKQPWIQKVDANPRRLRTPLEQEQNAELKFSDKEEEEDTGFRFPAFPDAHFSLLVLLDLVNKSFVRRW